MKKHCIESLFYTIEQTARICRYNIEQYFEEKTKGEISFDEFIIFDTIYCFPESCQRDLAKKVLKGTSHISKILSNLESKGLIQRPVDTKNNRMVRKIVLTDEGMKAYKIASKIASEGTKKVEEIISKEEAENCVMFLNKIKDTVNPTNDVLFE